MGNGSYLAHGGFQHFQEQQDTLSAQPGPEDFFCVVLLQQPLKHGIQAVLKERAKAAKGPVATHQGGQLSGQGTVLPGGPVGMAEQHSNTGFVAGPPGELQPTECIREMHSSQEGAEDPTTCVDVSSFGLTSINNAPINLNESL